MTLTNQFSSIESGIIMLHEEKELANTKSLYWSVQPLLKFMQIIFALPQTSPKRRKIIAYIHLLCRCIAWLTTIFLHSCHLFLFFNWDIVYMKFFKSGATYSWVLLIKYVSKAVHSVGIHTVMLFMLPKNWKMLLESLEETENNFRSQRRNYYSTIWKACVAGVIYIILSVIRKCIRNLSAKKQSLRHKFLFNFQGWIFDNYSKR